MPLVPTKSMRITLTYKAVEMLVALRKGGVFRSSSATIEECIWRISFLLEDSSPEAVKVHLGRFRRSLPREENK